MNAFSRIALCGQISGYNHPDALTVRNFRSFLVNRIQLRGFICSDHLDLWKPALKELGDLVHAGSLKYRETIAQGLNAAPAAFIGLLNGKNFGKQLVKLI
jgi:NADPH-dependent curcumin reductase CurA